MPSPAKRVAAQPMNLDDRDLLAISEEKKAMVLTFGAGGLLCAGNLPHENPVISYRSSSNS